MKKIMKKKSENRTSPIIHFFLNFMAAFFFLAGIAFLSDAAYWCGILFFIGGLLILPKFVNFLMNKLEKNNVTKKHIHTLGIIVLVMAFILVPTNSEDEKDLKDEKQDNNKNGIVENTNKENDETQKEDNFSTNDEVNEESDSTNDNTNKESESNYSNIKNLSTKKKENFITALKECNMQPDKVKNVTKLEDWNNGSRYSFTYNGDMLYLYVNDDDTISSINLSLGGLKIYDEKYESLNYNNYYISMDMSIKMGVRAESSVDMYLKDSSSANYKWTNYQRTGEYYAISGSVTANNSFGQPVSNTVYVEFKYQNESLSVIYISLNGANTYGAKVVPEIKRKERKIVDTSTNEKIVLNDGVVGNYGKYDTFDGEKYLRFYVPAGKYKATALVKNSMFYVESIKLHKEDGYDVATTYETVRLNKKGDSQTIEIKNGQCISLVMGTKIELVKIK